MATSPSRLKTDKKAFDAQVFLDSAGVARKIVEYPKKTTIYAQGDPAKTILYVQQGSVKLSVVNSVGKEAVVATFSGKVVFQLSLSELEEQRRLPQLQYLSLRRPR